MSQSKQQVVITDEQNMFEAVTYHVIKPDSEVNNQFGSFPVILNLDLIVILRRLILTAVFTHLSFLLHLLRNKLNIYPTRNI